MAELISSNNDFIVDPSEKDIEVLFNKYPEDEEFNISLRRHGHEYLKLSRTNNNTFIAEYQKDRPRIQYRSLVFSVTNERAARILYYYSKHWDPRDFDELKWVSKTIIDKAFYNIKVLANVSFALAILLSCIIIYLINKDIYSSFTIKLEFLLVFVFGFLSCSEEIYLWYYYDEPIYHRTWVVIMQLPIFIIYLIVSELIF